ncbi:beta-1,3-galactosyltransferase 5-like [Paramuricea clavata]|uniref:Hexosyltransferase n=1 Tax=Paramuricea clavata TaxID=317549 RepID=A0A6S7JK68_PARCT|nr:beta-1,3-galactosyltransferase 5-like [Paramuricea clavata]
MASLKRYKRKFMVLVLLFLVCSVWTFVNYFVHASRLLTTSDSSTIRHPEGEAKAIQLRECIHNFKRNSSTEVDMTTGSIDSLNAANVAMFAMLKGINRTLIKFINNFHASKISENPVATTRKPTVDIINDYYPFVDFKFVFPEISPKVETTPEIFMMVLVNSGAKGNEFRKRREAIRQTWGNRSNCEQRKAMGDERKKNLRWLLVFVVGKAGPGTNDDELNMAEAGQHNDMLIGNITDNYINNVVKFYMGQVWASKFDIKYTFKTDDDVYVRIPRVLGYLVNAKFPRPFYGGMTYLPIRVNRVISGKWTVSWKYFGEVNFPMFNAGAFFILSTDLLNRLFNYVYIRKPFHIDDAYVGVAMRDFGVKTRTIFSFAVRPDMSEFIHKAEDCTILRLDGFGHNMDPESARFLHNRLTTLACGNMHLKC